MTTVSIVMQDKETGKRMLAAQCRDIIEANAIVAELNRINAEAARMTGTAIRFVYSIMRIK